MQWHRRHSVLWWPWILSSTSISAHGQPHIWNHYVDEEEVEEVLTNRGEDRPGRDGSRVAIGQTDSGRYLKVVYVRDWRPDSIFVVTAYELRANERESFSVGLE